MAKVLIENSVVVQGMKDVALKDRTYRAGYRYTDNGVEKRNRVFVRISEGDTKETAKAKAISKINSQL